jgi:L-fuconolactonase
MTQAIDAHQHFWDPARVALPWLTEAHAPIARPFEPADLEPLLADAGIGQTVLVQAANSDADTDLMLEHAAAHEWIAAVIAWAELADAEKAAERLDELASQPKVRGIRHLIHDEEDPHWIVRPRVLDGLRLLEQRGLILELSVVFPRHIGDVPALARSFPELTIVIDHLGKPPLDRDGFDRWQEELSAAAEPPNVMAKISGLDGRTDPARPVAAALGAFGTSRLLCGSDWPVSLLFQSYVEVWSDIRDTIESLAPDHVDDVLAGNARRLYAL